MKIYVSNFLSKSISVIDRKTFKLEKNISLGCNVYPHDFFIEKEENLLFIPGMTDGVLYIIDLISGKTVDNVSIGGSLNQVLVYGDEIFVLNEDSDSVHILNKKNYEPLASIKVGKMPHGFELSKSDKKLYVSSENFITCINIEDMNIENLILSEHRFWHLKIDHFRDEIYVPTLDGKVIIFDRKSFEIKDILSGFILPVEIAFNYSKNKFYVNDLGYGHVKVFDYNTKEYIKDIKNGGVAQGILVTKDEEVLIVSDSRNNCVDIYDSESDEIINCIKVEKEPTAIICL